MRFFEITKPDAWVSSIIIGVPDGLTLIQHRHIGWEENLVEEVFDVKSRDITFTIAPDVPLCKPVQNSTLPEGCIKADDEFKKWIAHLKRR